MEDQQLPSASVIVVGFNSRRYLNDCLGSVLRQDYPGSVEVLFVDNQSTDGSAEFVRAAFPEVHVLETGGNLGYAGGNNYGARVAIGSALVFLNPDTIAESDWLRELIAPLADDPTIGLTTSKITLMSDPEVINTCGNDVSLAGVATCRRIGQQAEDVVVDEDVASVSGAAFAIKAQLFNHLGGFDDAFWMYVEDTDLSWRARRAGFRCLLAASSVVAHDYELKMSPRKIGCIERNRYRMLAKNLSGWSTVVLLPVLLASESVNWGWAIVNGPRYLMAKFLAVLWLISHIPELLKSHQNAKGIAQVPDAVVLRRHVITPPFTLLDGGFVGRAASAVIPPIILVVALPTLMLLNILASARSKHPESADDPVEEVTSTMFVES